MCAVKVASLYGELTLKDDQFKAGLTGAKTGIGGLGDMFKQLTGFSLGTATALGLAGIGIKKVGDFARDSINETVAYNKEIREMTQVTGLGAEEISRIVQVGDDWGVSIDAIRTSLAFMNKTGITPSIDNLAKLADEYVASSDKSAFAEKAVKVLGRGYQTLIPLLALGGDGFRNAAAGIEKNLIVTDKSIESSRKFEVALDQLHDTVQGLEYSLGNGLIPTLVKLLGSLNTGISIDQRFTDAMDEANKSGDTAYKNDINRARSIPKVNDAIVALNNAEALHLVTLGLVDKGERDLIKTTDAVTVAFTNYAGSTRKVQSSAVELAKIHTAEYLDGLKKSAEAAKEANDKLYQSYDDMNYAIGGKLGPSEKDFITSQDELNTKMGEIQGEIDKAIKEGYDPLSEKVLGLQGDYNDLKDQYGNNATAHEDATKRIMFDILEQRAAIGGLTTDEINFLQQIATSWGLPDQATLTYMQDADASLNYLANNPGDVAGARQILQGIGTDWGNAADAAGLAEWEVRQYGAAIINLPENKVVHLTTIYDTVGHRDYASGGDFIVPPGYPNDTYPINVSSGEHVTVTPTHNWNFSVNNPTANGFQLYQQFRQALESDMRARGRGGVPYSDY